MSSDDEGDLQVDVSDLADDPSAHCPVCRGSTFIGETIACEVCEMWYHFSCVDVTGTDDVVTKEDVPYFCPSCRDPSGAALKKVQRKEKKKRKKKQNPPPPKKRAVSNMTISVGESATVAEPMKSPPIKLKINLSSAAVSSSPVSSGSESSPKVANNLSKSGKSLLKVAVSPSLPLTTSLSATADDLEDAKKRKRRTSEDEEERWLDAVESGDMIIDPELRSIKDPERMTVRQRAMVERSKLATASSGGEEPSLEEEGHMALDYGYKKKEEENEHTMRIKALKSQKRKEVEMEKREENKKKTMDRLLKKKDSKLTKQAKTMRPLKREIPHVTYRLTLDGATVSMPPGYDFPCERKKPVEPPSQAFCSVPGCSNPKKYSCSKSGRPLCSLKCYRQNLIST